MPVTIAPGASQIRQEWTCPVFRRLDKLPHMDFRHIVFPELSTDLYRSRQKRIAKTLEAVETALGKEKRDLQREAAGGEPIEGVGVDVARIDPAIAANLNEQPDPSVAVS